MQGSAYISVGRARYSSSTMFGKWSVPVLSRKEKRTGLQMRPCESENTSCRCPLVLSLWTWGDGETRTTLSVIISKYSFPPCIMSAAANLYPVRQPLTWHCQYLMRRPLQHHCTDWNAWASQLMLHFYFVLHALKRKTISEPTQFCPILKGCL